MTCRKCRGRIIRHVEGRSRQYRCFNCGVTTFLEGDGTVSVPSATPPSRLLESALGQLPPQFALADLLHYLWSQDNEPWTTERLRMTLRARGYRIGSWQGVVYAQKQGFAAQTATA